MTHKEPVHRADPNRSAALDQSRLNLNKGHVSLLGEQLLDEVALRCDPARVAVAPATLGNRSTMLQRKASPADRA